MDRLAEPVTCEQAYLAAIWEELRGLRQDLNALSRPPELPKVDEPVAKKKKPIQILSTRKSGAKGNKRKAQK